MPHRATFNGTSRVLHLPRGNTALVRGVATQVSDEEADLLSRRSDVKVTGGASATGAPSQTDPKHVWVDAAVACGYDRDEAESMTKAELMEMLA